MQKKCVKIQNVKIQIVTDSLFIDQKRRVMSFFEAIELNSFKK